MSIKTEKLLTVMHILAWITFIGLLVKAGALLFNYCMSMATAGNAKNLYEGLDYYALRQFSFWHYTTLFSLLISFVVLEAFIAYQVTRVLAKIKMSHPFTIEIVHLLDRLSHLIIGAWVLVMLYNAHAKWLAKRVDGMETNLISGEFIFLAGVVLVLAQIFKRGVEMQSENELTV